MKIYLYNINLLFFFVLISNGLLSQVDTNKIPPLMMYRIFSTNNQNKECVKTFLEIKNDKNVTQWDYYNAAQCAVKSDLTNEAVSFLKMAILKGLDSSDITSDNIFESIWIMVRKEYSPLRKKYFQTETFDMDYILAVNEIHITDQSLRKDWMDKKNVYKNDSVFDYKLQTTDSINYEKLYQLILETGWPTYEKIGSLNDFIIPIFIHINKGKEFDWSSAKWKYILNQLQIAIDNGKENPSTMAILTDSYFVQVKKTKALYGCMYKMERDQMIYAPIEDIRNVDSRRLKIGLPSLEIDAKMYGRILPKEYKINE